MNLLCILSILYSIVIVTEGRSALNLELRMREKVSGLFGELNVEGIQWRTSLSNGTEADVTGYISEPQRAMLLVSKDENLKENGFKKSLTLVDFISGKIAIRVNDAAEDFSDAPWEQMKRQSCFIADFTRTSTDVISDFDQISQGSAVPFGAAIKYVAEMAKRISGRDLRKMSSKLHMFCRQATKMGKPFILQEGFPDITVNSALRVLGPVTE